MENVTKAAGIFLVFCLGVLLLLGGVVLVINAVKPVTTPAAQPYWTPPTTRCPYCSRDVNVPRFPTVSPTPNEIMPTPNIRPGSQTGDKGEKK